MRQIREALTPEAIGASAGEGVWHEGRFYLPVTEEARVAVPEEPAFPHGVTLSVGYASDVGMARDLDEDSLCVFTLSGVYESVAEPALGLFIVADGMGGHEGGEVASKLAVQVIAGHLIEKVLLPRFTVEDQPLSEAVREHLIAAIRDANQRIYALAREHNSDMGCTLTLALVMDGKAYIANVGDSRTYVYGRGGLRQITTDHSVVASLIAAGMAQPEEIYTHPSRSVVYRALGIKGTVEVDIWEEGLLPGDTLFLCCDGVWEAIRNEGIEEVLLARPDPQAACDEMVRRANQAGGEDNISVIVVGVKAAG
jgi:serine/threonine protein phosphatase PrpC